MPWEIDYALLTFTQLKKSKYHLPNNVNITIDSVLNLSSYLIDWDESQLPKDVFIPFYHKTINSIYVKASSNDGYEQIVQVSPNGKKLMVYRTEE